MSVHPVLASLRSQIPVHFIDDNSVTFCFWSKRRELHRMSLYVGNKNDIELHYSVALRCVVVLRTEKYVEILQQRLEDNFQLALNGSTVEAVISWTPKEYVSSETVAKFIVGEVHAVHTFFQTFAEVARVSYRLLERGGTKQWKILVPTRLAELTLCGLDTADRLQ